MANPTSNYGWQMPTPTDLVTDLPADFEVFGQAVDTALADLLGGASGYILSKNSATNMDFAWIPNDTNSGRGLMAYVTNTTSISASANTETVSLTTPSFTAVTGRLYKITYYEPDVPLTQNSNATTARIRLTNTGGTQLQAGVATNASATAGFQANFGLTCLTTLTAGSTVIVATLFFAGAAQTASRASGKAGVLVVEDIGVA